jgi:hypothetical protein
VVNLTVFSTDGDIEVKRKIIGSIFPEKLQFSKNHYRTTRPNVLLSYIYQINNELGTKKNRKESELSPLSGLVPTTEEISKYLIEDLERISEITNPSCLP